REWLLRADLARKKLFLAGDHLDGWKGAREQRRQPWFDLEHNGRCPSEHIWQHAGLQNLVAETLLTPYEKRAVDSFTIPARLRITGRHKALGAGRAMLITRPASRKAPEAEANEPLVPFRRHIIRLERDDPIEHRDGVIEALEIGEEIGVYGERVRIVRSQ